MQKQAVEKTKNEENLCSILDSLFKRSFGPVERKIIIEVKTLEQKKNLKNGKKNKGSQHS